VSEEEEEEEEEEGESRPSKVERKQKSPNATSKRHLLVVFCLHFPVYRAIVSLVFHIQLTFYLDLHLLPPHLSTSSSH